MPGKTLASSRRPRLNITSFMLRHKLVFQSLLSLIIGALALLWTYKYVRIFYAINDDVTFRKIASGSFSGVPDGHLIYPQYALGWLISRLYLINNHFDWYGITLLGSIFLCLALILFKAMQAAHTTIHQIQALGLVLAGYVLFGLQHVAEFQFTTSAAVLGGTAIFWIYTSAASDTRGAFVDGAVGACLMVASYMVRSSVMLMCLPFASIAFVHRYLGWPNRQTLQWSFPALTLVGLLMVLAIERAAYSDPAWQDYLRLLQSDVQIFDYCGLPPYAEHAQFYKEVGVSQPVYELLDRYTLVPNPAVNIQTYEAIAAKCMELQRIRFAARPLLSQVDHVAYTAFRTMLEERYALIAITCVALFFALLIRRGPRLGNADALLIGSIIACHFGVWFYLIANGRFPSRVLWAVYLVEMLMLAAIALKDGERTMPGQGGVLQSAVAVVGVLVALGLVSYQTQTVRAAVDDRAEDNKGCEKVYEYAENHPDNFYFLSTRSFSYCTLEFSFRVTDHLDNYTYMGDFDFYSPPVMANWRQNGLGDVEQNLVRRRNILILIKPPDSIRYVVDYYHSVGVDAEPVVVADFNLQGDSQNVIVYRLTTDKDAVP